MANATRHLRTSWASAVAVLAAGTTPALGHSLLPGVSGYPALMLHPLLITHQALALITAMLLIARSPALSRWRTVLAFIVALGIGHIAQGMLPALFTYYWIAASALIAIAATLAATLDPVPPRLAFPAIVVLGAIIGLDTHGEGSGLWPRLQAVSAAGLAGALLLLAAGFVGGYALPRPLRILARILGAWIAAATIMILAFALKP